MFSDETDCTGFLISICHYSAVLIFVRKPISFQNIFAKFTAVLESKTFPNLRKEHVRQNVFFIFIFAKSAQHNTPKHDVWISPDILKKLDNSNKR